MKKEKRPTQAEVNILNIEYMGYIAQLKRKWAARHRMRSRNVYEVMTPEEHAEVRYRISEWARYVTPLAEAWWKERGFGIIWPDDNSKPIKLYPLDTAA